MICFSSRGPTNTYEFKFHSNLCNERILSRIGRGIFLMKIKLWWNIDCAQPSTIGTWKLVFTKPFSGKNHFKIKVHAIVVFDQIWYLTTYNTRQPVYFWGLHLKTYRSLNCGKMVAVELSTLNDLFVDLFYKANIVIKHILQWSKEGTGIWEAF